MFRSQWLLCNTTHSADCKHNLAQVVLTLSQCHIQEVLSCYNVTYKRFYLVTVPHARGFILLQCHKQYVISCYNVPNKVFSCYNIPHILTCHLQPAGQFSPCSTFKIKGLFTYSLWDQSPDFVGRMSGHDFLKIFLQPKETFNFLWNTSQIFTD